MLKKFLADESAATAIEYGLIVALMGIAIISGASVTGSSLSELWAGNDSSVTNALGN